VSGDRYRVVFSPEALDQLGEIEEAISQAGAARAAATYVDAIVGFCEQLERFPARGVPRDDLLHGLRITHYRGRAVIAYQIVGDRVAILGVYYGGQDYEATFFTD
jgi:toxin ParE1/3/4